MKSRMGFHRRRQCCIVLVVRDDVECSGYTLVLKIRPHPHIRVSWVHPGAYGRSWVYFRSHGFGAAVLRIIPSTNPLLHEEASFSCLLALPFVGAGSVPSFGVYGKRIRS